MICRRYTIKALLVLITVALFSASCMRSSKSWDTQLAAPLLNTSLQIDDVIADSFLIKASDSSYIFSYRYPFAIDSFGDHLQVPDTVNQVTVSLDKLILSDKALTDTITLREMSPQIGLLDGKMVDLPAQSFSDAGGQDIDISKDFFKRAKFIDGYLDLVIYNDLPVEVETMSFVLKNKQDGLVIASDVFTNILPGDSVKQSYSLAGKEVLGILVGEIQEVKTYPSNGEVLIDADKGVRIGMNVRDLEPLYATAVFPAQDLVTDTQEVGYNFGKSAITEMMVYKGEVTMTVHSTIEESIKLDYRIPFSGKNGDFSAPFTQLFTVPPAKPGETQIVERKIPLDDYVIQYKGKDPLSAPFFNTIYSELVASIVYSGIERSISLQDSVFIEFGFVNIKPAYAYGDFGYDETTVLESADVKAMKQLEGEINFEDMWMSVLLENNFGIEANVKVNRLSSINSKTGTRVDLSNPDLIDQTIFLAKAINYPPLEPYKRNFVLNQSNSNVQSFLENLPDKVEADIYLESRPYGSNHYTNFVFRESFLRATLNLNLPLQFSLGNMQLTQKQKFNLTDDENVDRIKEGSFQLRVENDFPIGAQMKLEFLDDEENILLELFADAGEILAADVPSGKERTEKPTINYLSAQLGSPEIELLRSATKVRTIATFNTPGTRRYKMFNDYSLDVKLSADFVYEQNF